MRAPRRAARCGGARAASRGSGRARGWARAQILAHEWVATRGGVVPRLLQPTVVRGAANVASVRRLRNLVHGVVALKRVVVPVDGAASPPDGPASPGGSVHRGGASSPLDRCGRPACIARWAGRPPCPPLNRGLRYAWRACAQMALELACTPLGPVWPSGHTTHGQLKPIARRSVHARREFERRRRAGGDAAARGRSGLENMAMRLNARALSRLHDTGARPAARAGAALRAWAPALGLGRLHGGGLRSVSCSVKAAALCLRNELWRCAVAWAQCLSLSVVCL